MARNAINEKCEFKIGLKRTIGPRGKPFSSKGHTTMHHTHPFCTQIERESPANRSVIFVISSDREF
jgi:hypothetical protein